VVEEDRFRSGDHAADADFEPRSAGLCRLQSQETTQQESTQNHLSLRHFSSSFAPGKPLSLSGSTAGTMPAIEGGFGRFLSSASDECSTHRPKLSDIVPLPSRSHRPGKLDGGVAKWLRRRSAKPLLTGST